MHANDPAGDSVPAVHVYTPPPHVDVCPAAHDGAHVAPGAMVAPLPHCVALATTGSVHGRGLHENVAGVSVPNEHASAVALLTANPPAHAGVHDVACDTTAPPPHAVALATTGCVQLGASHHAPVPSSTPVPALHVYRGSPRSTAPATQATLDWHEPPAGTWEQFPGVAVVV